MIIGVVFKLVSELWSLIIFMVALLSVFFSCVLNGRQNIVAHTLTTILLGLFVFELAHVCCRCIFSSSSWCKLFQLISPSYLLLIVRILNPKFPIYHCLFYLFTVLCADE